MTVFTNISAKYCTYMNSYSVFVLCYLHVKWLFSIHIRVYVLAHMLYSIQVTRHIFCAARAAILIVRSIPSTVGCLPYRIQQTSVLDKRHLVPMVQTQLLPRVDLTQDRIRAWVAGQAQCPHHHPSHWKIVLFFLDQRAPWVSATRYTVSNMQLSGQFKKI